MTRLALSLLAASVAFTIGCSVRGGPQTAAQTAPSKVTVSVAPAVVRRVPVELRQNGTFVADEAAEIAPLAAGRILRTAVNVGDFVQEGQIVCELDHRDAALRLDQARAQLAQATSALRQAQSRIGLAAGANFDAEAVPEAAGAKAAYQSALAVARQAAADAKRYENLVATGDVSRSAYEKAKTQQDTADAQANAARQQYEAALNGARQGYGGVQMSEASLEGVRSQVAQAEKALADTTVHAPFAGYITARPVSPGDYVAVGKTVAGIVRVNVLKLQLQTPEQSVARVRAGMPVKARVAAYPDREFEGKVSAINPSVDPNSRIFVIEARFDNRDNALRPGMFATARVLQPGGEDAVFVPRAAVLRDKTTDSYEVFAIENQVARLKVVVTGEPDGDLVRIVSGLAGNESVATRSLNLLFDGAPVHTQN